MRAAYTALPLATIGMLSLTLAASSPILQFSDLLIDALSANSTNSAPDFTQPPLANISLYPNGSLFSHWRPRAHFIHPSNQLGDPTAFWQAPDGTSHITALYSYLRGTGNSSLFTSGFSGSTTRNFLQYEDLSGWENPVQMGPGNEVDFLADFDGSVVAEGYMGLPTLIWTAVKGEPISWTIPYKDGYESQALAYSEDNGTTWKKLDGGANVPVIPRPPYSGNVVTGFRDPFIFKNAQFDALFNISSSSNRSTNGSQPMHYVTLSSGLHPSQPGLPGVEFDQAGPRIWLYRQSEPGNWLNWTFCGPLLHSRINTTFVTPNSGWAATDYSDGNNYETSQITNLDYAGDSSSSGNGMAYISYGAESNHTLMLYRLGHWVSNRGIDALPINATLVSGVNGSDAGVEMQTALEGVLDWGLAYACTGLRDESKKDSSARRMVYCWIKEAFATQDATKFVTQYISSLTLPRQLYVRKIQDVMNNELVLQNASWAILNTTAGADEDGRIETIPVQDFKFSNETSSVDLVMLGISPADELLEFRTKANDSYHLDSPSSLYLSPANLADSSNSTGSDVPKGVEVRRGIPSGDNGTLVDEVFIPLPRTPSSRHYELETTLHFPSSSLRNVNATFAAGVSILRRPQTNTTTEMDGEDVAIVYQPRNESIIVQRRTALRPESVLTTPEVGKLRLWQLASNSTTNSPASSSFSVTNDNTTAVQPLNMRVFVDGSAIEIYINDVFVLTTRGYYWYDDSTSIGFVYQLPHNDNGTLMQDAGEEEDGWKVEMTKTSWWEGLIDAYPNRPTDPSQLIKQAIGYPEPTNNPNAAGIIYNGTGPSPPFYLAPA